MKKRKILSITGVFILTLIAGSVNNIEDNPVRVHPQNFMYFTDDSGKAMVFTCCHTWMKTFIKPNRISQEWILFINRKS